MAGLVGHTEYGKLKAQLNEYKEKCNLSKLLDLLTIKGSSSQIDKQIRAKQGILWPKRLFDCLEYFTRLEEMLAHFDIYSSLAPDSPIVWQNKKRSATKTGS